MGSYAVTGAPAYRVDDRRYRFNALGQDIRLYTKPEAEDTITHLASPLNVPLPISRRVLHHDLDRYYGYDEQGAVRSLLLHADGRDILPVIASPPASPPEPALKDLIAVCDLSDREDGTGWAHQPGNHIAIDPLLGRIAFPTHVSAPQNVQVTYRYGFSADLGGGEYGQAGTFAKSRIVIQVAKNRPDTTAFTTIQQAVDELVFRLAAAPEEEGGAIEIIDNAYYAEPFRIDVPPGRLVELRAGDQRRPVLLLGGEVIITGGEYAQLSLNGLLVSGGLLRVPTSDAQNRVNRLRQLSLRHCTLAPGTSSEFRIHDQTIAAQPEIPRLVVEADDTQVLIDRCIVGALRCAGGAEVRIDGSIIDAGAKTAVAYAAPDGEGAGAPLAVESSTLIGRVHTRWMQRVSNTIFLASPAQNVPAPVVAQRLQEGCARFSYIPPGSQVPRQYRCQPADPDLAARVKPIFVSLRYGDPGYCQLSSACASEIGQGAEDGAEMGVFHDLYQPQRESDLRHRLDEYLRFGLEAGIFYAS